MNIVEKLASENLLTAQQVERIGKNVSEMLKAAQEDPRLMEDALKKMAQPGAGAAKGFWGKAVEHAKQYAPLAVGSAIVGGGMTLGSRATQTAYTGVKDAIVKSQAFKEMIETSPELGDANPDLVQKGFNTLYKFNPEFAKDPLVAGTFVRNVVEQERLNLGDVKSLIDARKSMVQSAPKGVDFFSMPPADIYTKVNRNTERQPESEAPRGAPEEESPFTDWQMG